MCIMMQLRGSVLGAFFNLNASLVSRGILELVVLFKRDWN